MRFEEHLSGLETGLREKLGEDVLRHNLRQARRVRGKEHEKRMVRQELAHERERLLEVALDLVHLAARAAAEAAKQEEENAEPEIELIDVLPSASDGYGFAETTAAPEATLPPATK